jgi:hypothetical protein
MRIKPSALVGTGIWLLYGAVIVVTQKMSGIPYTDFGDTTSNMWRSVIPSLAAGAVVIGLVGLWLGWWGAAMRDRHRTRVGWALIAPVIYLVVVGINFASTDWGRVSGGFLLVALLLGVLVGFAEEFLCRGLLLVGLRGSVGEVAVWALTCLLFGLMHGANIFLGAPVGSTAVQVVMAGIQGSAFYILRRYFGTLLVAMALHGLWDASIFIQANSGATSSPLAFISYLAIPFALVGGFVVARRTQRGPVEDYAVGAKDPAAVPA